MIYGLNLKRVFRTTGEFLKDNTFQSGFIFTSNRLMTCMFINYPMKTSKIETENVNLSLLDSTNRLISFSENIIFVN